ncbi:tail fiber assembly protein [Pseudomonas gingeri]|uniref:tail fiber assembly protein n=1 Tax=Pseudomonas gingeri TaxID=117681 RepID=UPI0015A4EC2E|nr:tail fiber assembly protein [Pseudomonas gingeri]NWA10675.1 tail fiber assembly protein [Pseudomonas gingeri]
MKKYVRITDGKVDNIYETHNDIAQEFPEGGLWVVVSDDAWVDYGFDAVNTDGVWTFSGMPSQTEAGFGKQIRLDKAYAQLQRTALPYKVELGLATAADEAYLLAHKQYVIALSEINKQPGFPTTINWPALP